MKKNKKTWDKIVSNRRKAAVVGGLAGLALSGNVVGATVGAVGAGAVAEAVTKKKLKKSLFIK